jgi:DNA-binding transcriptional MerR regulator
MLDLECTLGFKVVNMENELTIQQVSERTGLSVYTLRYYERNGLLEPVNRAANGHRRYSATDIARIEFLSKLRMTGMPIRQMQEYAALLRQKPDAIEERRAILEAHEQAVQQQIQQLTQNLEMIQWKIQNYRKLAGQHPETAHTNSL